MATRQAKDFLEAFERVEAEIPAVSKVAVINLEVTSAVTTALGALPAIIVFRDELTELKGFEVAWLDKLHDYGFALLHLQSVYRGFASPVNEVGGLAQELIVIRDQLFSDAAALGKRQLIDLGRVEKFRSGLGFKNLALDVSGLVQILRENAIAIAGRTAVTPADLDHAAELASRLFVTVGIKEQAPAATSEPARLRQQAFTLFTRAYREVRLAITYVRGRHGDANSIAPSLWAGRGGRKTSASAETSVASTDGTPLDEHQSSSSAT
ncbi:MAG TPA: hypothetical protein VER04_24985 [Polyangiaceae bacterium]|nr:hypothetical protein [Polyangiaceae bacterium]